MAEPPSAPQSPGNPVPGDRVRLTSSDASPEPGSSGLFELWEDEDAGLAKVHWDDQPFHVYDSVAVHLLELETPE